MECVDIGKYLYPAFFASMLLTLFAFWRMKNNAVEGFENQLNSYPVWKQLLADVIVPKSLLTETGKKWYYFGLIINVIFFCNIAAYVYFDNQSWVCKLGPQTPPTEVLKNVFKDS